MLEFCLLALPWVIDPALVQRTGREIAAPMATCVRPAMMVVEPNLVCASSKIHLSEMSAVSNCLRRWEHATTQTPERSRSQREDFRRRMQEDFNEHTAAAIEQLMGRVHEKSLTAIHEWQFVERTGDCIFLEAIPKDETERLFYGSLRVSIVAESGILEQLTVVDRNHSHRIAWRSERPVKDERIQLVRFENGIPPAPNAPLRTANLRVD